MQVDDTAFPHVETAPKLFNEAGYYTGILGKVHVGADETYPWTYRLESDSRDVAWVGDQSADFFHQSKAKQQPFFLTVGFVDPHRDVTTRGGFGNQETYDSRIVKKTYDPKEVEVPSWLTDLPETRRELAEYYEAINRTDQGIGFILDALDKSGLADDTLVIVTSDNGPPFVNAKTTLYDAGTCLPFIIRAPGQPKGIVNPNMISYIDVLPTLLDYANIPSKEGGAYAEPGTGGSTSHSVASPPRIGRSFLPVLAREDDAPESEWQHHVFGSHTFHELQNYWPTRVLRTRRYKYHRNIAWKMDFPFATDLYASLSFEGMRKASHPTQMGQRSLEAYLFRPKEELFDMKEDPNELVNLADKPEHAELLASLRRTLEEWQQTTHDLWFNRDGQSVEVLQRYKKDNLVVPDQLDMDLARPFKEQTLKPIDKMLA